MSKETELRTLTRLEDGEQLPWSSVPRSVRNGIVLSELLATGILVKTKRGAGSILQVIDNGDLRRYLDTRFPGRHTVRAGSAFTNQQRYRNSKAAAKTSIGVLMLRGVHTVQVNEEPVDLRMYTKYFGCFAAIKPRLKVPKLCLVENLDCFMRAEQLLGEHWVFAHTYGRLGSTTLVGLEATDILHFGDWDYTGLDEYLRLRESFPHARLHLPDQLEELWRTRSTPLKKEAVLTRRLRQTDDAEVLKVLHLLGNTNCFLEQQAVFPHQNTQP